MRRRACRRVAGPANASAIPLSWCKVNAVMMMNVNPHRRSHGSLTAIAIASIQCAALLAASRWALGAEAADNTPAPQPAPALSTNAVASQPAWLTQPMSLVDAINIALQQNANILKGKSDLEAAYGLVVQTKATVYPRLQGTAGFAYDDATETPDFGTLGSGAGTAGATVFPTLTERWNGGIRLSQSIYEGGRMRSAWRTARLTKEQALLQYQAVINDTMLDVRTAYFDVLLGEQEIVVQEASVKLLTTQLEDTTRRYEAGTVPKFNVLRAEVELANARPKLSRARNLFRIAKNNLANVLGYNVPPTVWEDIPLRLTGKLEAQPYDIALPSAIARALARRPELAALQKGELLRREDIVKAKSGRLPTVEVYAGYSARSPYYKDDFWSDVSGPNAGVQMNWNLWDGQLTKGRVMQATALAERARVDYDDATRRIELEVRTAYSIFLEAREVLESQKKVLEQADEALRLANSRYEAGTGTQLDVLDAQTSLTDARTTNVRALREYSVALARLQRAVAWDVPDDATSTPTTGKSAETKSVPPPTAPVTPPKPEEKK